jgi:hypothetical protein
MLLIHHFEDFADSPQVLSYQIAGIPGCATSPNIPHGPET